MVYTGFQAFRDNRIMISFLGTVETGLFGLFLFLFRTSLTFSAQSITYPIE